jgi:hypothetical protein
MILESNEQYQKHKLKELVGTKLDTFKPNKTETANMFDNGYRKIYDCGNNVYIKTFKKS